MKLIALRVQPIAKALALIYAGFGLLFWFSYCISSRVPLIVLPIGIETAWVHLDFKFNVYRGAGAWHYISVLLGSLICYAVSGWLTAVAIVLGFNLLAKYSGGVKADFLVLKEQDGEAASDDVAASNSMPDY